MTQVINPYARGQASITQMLDIAAITHPQQVASLLDVRLGDENTWFLGLKTATLFRIPGFASAHGRVRRNQKEAAGFDAVFLARAQKLAAALRSQAEVDWCDGGYSAAQLGLAQNGKPMRLDKAVVSVLALNDLAAEGVGGETPLADHCILACVFKFERMPELIELAVEDMTKHIGENTPKDDPEALQRDLKKARARVLRFLADLSGQDVPEIGDLARASSQPAAGKGRSKQLCASYRTQRAIYKALMRYPSCNDVLGAAARRDLIKFRRTGEPQATALAKERVWEPAPVTRPPYHWEFIKGPGGYPPEIDEADPFANPDA